MDAATHLRGQVIDGLPPLARLLHIGVEMTTAVKAIMDQDNTEVVLQVQPQIQMSIDAY